MPSILNTKIYNSNIHLLNETGRMDYFVYNVDEDTNSSSLQGNKYAPAWTFRLAVAGSSDSGKTTMVINLLMGNKKTKENGERYILCNDVVLIGRYLNEAKWSIVRDFFEELAETEDVSFRAIPYTEIPETSVFDVHRSTVVIFEDLMNAPKKVQEKISEYFIHGRHCNISSIYISQSFFSIPKTIRDNVNYISLHRGGGSLADIKRIISLYTESSATLAPVIDDLTLKREFIVFDLRRSRIDPLSIRVRWDISLRSIMDQSEIGQSSVNVISMTSSKEGDSKFSAYGQKAIALAKKNDTLIEFARNFPSPKERNVLLGKGISAKNSNIWRRLVFREAYGIKGKDLGQEWTTFSKRLSEVSRGRTAGEVDQLSYINELLNSGPLDDKKIAEACGALLTLFSDGYIDKQALCVLVKQLCK
jgi:hypothetical protein